MLDERLSLVYEMIEPCGLGADIGTDHGQLASALLRAGRCERMILTDLSESALSHAREEMIRCRLTDRVSLRLGDGLAPLAEKCDFISITGMGGRTIRDILIQGQGRLMGTSLVLSAHTDLPMVRRAVMEIGYHFDREEPCLAAGRYYLVMRARPGREELTERQIRMGVRLAESGSPLLEDWYRRRLVVLRERQKGLRSAAEPDEEMMAEIEEDIQAYRGLIEKSMEVNEKNEGSGDFGAD